MLVDEAAGFERRVETNPRLWPQKSSIEIPVDLFLDQWVADGNERGDVLLVIVDNASTKLENVHASTSWPATLPRSPCASERGMFDTLGGGCNAEERRRGDMHLRNSHVATTSLGRPSGV